jgi:hypothetical protein
MGKRETSERLQELFDKNIPVYSYSKLSSWDECKYNWYMSYILKIRSKDNIYSKIGEVSHDSLERVYHHEEELKTSKELFNKAVKELEQQGIKFPDNPPTTKSNYIVNMNHFFDNYKILDVDMITEQFVLLSIPRTENAINDEDFIWIQMYIDSVIPVCEGDEIKSIIVNDWKTSSSFDKEKKLKASRQLLIYKLGVEQKTKTPVSKLGWTMLKYVYCCYRTKGSKAKPSELKQSMQERKNSVKYFYKKIVADLIETGMDTMEAELLTGKAVNQNSFKVLPEFIQEKYWIEDCFLECEFDDISLQECKNWVINIINKIESIENTSDLSNFPPVEINEKSSYFCFNLCGRPDCIHLIKYKNNNSDNFKRDKKEDEINKEIGITSKKINLDDLFK